jgi:hypothetical protein
MVDFLLKAIQRGQVLEEIELLEDHTDAGAPGRAFAASRTS